jgi:hypothetical protein
MNNEIQNRYFEKRIRIHKKESNDLRTIQKITFAEWEILLQWNNS